MTVLVVTLAIVGAFCVVLAAAAILSWGRRVHGWTAGAGWCCLAAPILAAGYWALAGLALAVAAIHTTGGSADPDVTTGQGLVVLAVYVTVALAPLAGPVRHRIERRWALAHSEQLSVSFGLASLCIPVLLLAGGVLGVS